MFCRYFHNLLHCLQASGDGLVKSFTHTPADFTIAATKPGLVASAQLSVIIKAENGETADPSIDDSGDGNYNISYTATVAGDYHVCICFEDQHIPGSPFRATVLERPDPEKCIVKGSCLAPDALRLAGDPLELAVLTKDAGHGKLRVTAIGPDNQPTRASLQESTDVDGEVSVSIETKHPGDYTVNVLWNDEPIPNSPFRFNVLRRLTASDMEVR